MNLRPVSFAYLIGKRALAGKHLPYITLPRAKACGETARTGRGNPLARCIVSALTSTNRRHLDMRRSDEGNNYDTSWRTRSAEATRGPNSKSCPWGSPHQGARQCYQWGGSAPAGWPVLPPRRFATICNPTHQMIVRFLKNNAYVTVLNKT